MDEMRYKLAAAIDAGRAKVVEDHGVYVRSNGVILACAIGMAAIGLGFPPSEYTHSGSLKHYIVNKTGVDFQVLHEIDERHCKGVTARQIARELRCKAAETWQDRVRVWFVNLLS